jgi:anti-sigma regulatory factor (Ser/Thr protein kinase)
MTDDARARPRPGMNVAAGDGESAALDQAFDDDSLYALWAAVAAHGSQAGLSEGRTRDLVLAVHELAANAVRHGAGQGRLRLWAAPDAVRCEVTDTGIPGEAADAARWQAEPGHGLWLVRRIADSASVRSGASGTVAAVTFRRVRSWPSDDAG